MNRRRIGPIMTGLSSPLLLLLLAGGGGASAPGDRRADQESLAPLAPLVGEWRGTGQPRRGSSEGAWRESASWSWSLSSDSAALAMRVEDGRFLRSALVRPDPDRDGRFLLEATLADGSLRTFAGTADPKGRFRFEPESPADGEPLVDGLRRITLTPLHETRLLMLLEGRRPGSTVDERLAEVGYTRSGVPFAAGTSGPECIVTGGRGTIPVMFRGKTYSVCCSGCKDLFDEDPEAIVSEYERERREAGSDR